MSKFNNKMCARHDIAEILLMLTLITIQTIKSINSDKQEGKSVKIIFF